MGRTRRAVVLILGAAAVWTLSAAAGLPQEGQRELTPEEIAGKKAEDVYKNIQVLKGVPADQVLSAMQFISASLGVECEHCHVRGAMDKDDKLPKVTARKMMQMMFAINKDNFEGRQQVTCYSCHHGAPDPAPIPIVAEEGAQPPVMPGGPAMGGPGPAGHGGPPGAGPGGAVRPPPLPAATALIDKYIQALGGADALEKISSRVEKGTVTAFGHQLPIEVYAKAPDKRMSAMHMSQGDSITTFDGRTGWLAFGGQPPREMYAHEAEGAKLDADFYFPVRVKHLFNHFRVFPPEKIGDHEAYVVLARGQDRPPVRLYFDKDSGLLVRLVRYVETPVGLNPTEIDYADYRDADGVKVPFRWTLARPSARFTIQVNSLEQNVPIDDSKFKMPAAKAGP